MDQSEGGYHPHQPAVSSSGHPHVDSTLVEPVEPVILYIPRSLRPAQGAGTPGSSAAPPLSRHTLYMRSSE